MALKKHSFGCMPALRSHVFQYLPLTFIMKTAVISIILNLFALCIYAQNGIVEIETIYTNEDAEKQIIVINRDICELNSLFPGEKNTIQSGNSQYSFVTPIFEFEYGQAYDVKDSEGKYFDLYFTQLPIINITTSNTIVDEPKVYAVFTLCESSGNFMENRVGIEYRGGWTQTLPKKSYSIEFWDDRAGNETKEFSLLGMRSDDDWNIQAMYNEPLRLRSKANFELWRKIDTLYYMDDEPEAINGVRQEYVELFFNNSYKGVYALSEKPDRKQFKIRKYKNSEIKGELYKGVSWGASTYTSLPSSDNNSKFWGGFEYIHPVEEIKWDNIYEFVNFVINEDSVDFYNSYHEKFNINNAVNYFIFLNLLRATDNTGKNIIVAKYNTDEPYFFIPWDLDGTYGIIWNGTQENITNDILTNGFFKKLIIDNNFTDKLTDRWNELRKDIITVDSIMSVFNLQFSYLKSNGVYERELIAWQDCNFLDLENLDYTSKWLSNRLDYLDNVFNEPELLTGIKQIANQNTIKIYPNPANKYVSLELENPLAVHNIKIINSLGICVYDNNEFTSSIDISGLSNGIYFFIINLGNGGNQTERIMIKSK